MRQYIRSFALASVLALTSQASAQQAPNSWILLAISISSIPEVAAHGIVPAELAGRYTNELACKHQELGVRATQLASGNHRFIYRCIELVW